MSSLSSLWVSKEKLEMLLKEVGSKSGIELTICIRDENSERGTNVTAYIAQTEEERNSNKPKTYIGNGNTFYTDGIILQCRKPKKNG